MPEFILDVHSPDPGSAVERSNDDVGHYGSCLAALRPFYINKGSSEPGAESATDSETQTAKSSRADGEVSGEVGSWISLAPAVIPEERHKQHDGLATSQTPHFSQFDAPVGSFGRSNLCVILALHFLRIREKRTDKEPQALDSDEGKVSLVAHRPGLCSVHVESQRDRATHDIAEVSKREPSRNVSSTLILLWISRCDGALDAPEESCADAACDGPKVDKPRRTSPVVDVQASGV